jgi:hypothetical protein
VTAQQERPFAPAGVDANGSPDWTAGLLCMRRRPGFAELHAGRLLSRDRFCDFALGHMESDQLVGRTTIPGRERATDKVGVIADHPASKPVPSVRHRGERRPAVCFGIVPLIFRKRMIWRELASQNQDQPVIKGAGNSATGRRQRSGGTPLAGFWIMRVVLARALEQEDEGDEQDSRQRMDRQLTFLHGSTIHRAPWAHRPVKRRSP